MHNIIDGQSVISAFFQALEQRALADCESAIAQLQGLTEQQPIFGIWSQYFEGILANERDHNWARAEQIFRRLLQENLELALRGRILVALGRTYEYQGTWLDAIHTHEQSLEIFTALDQPFDQAKAKKQIAIACCRGFIAGAFGIEWLHKGETHCYEALALLKQARDSQWFFGSIFSTLGSINTYLQRWEQALAYYQRDLAICEQLGDQHGMGVSYLNLGEVYQRRPTPDWRLALHAYQQALAILRQYQNRYLEADVLTNLGSLYQTMEESAQALTHYHQAVAVIEDLRTRISAAEARTGFFTTMVETYSRLVKLLIEMGDLPAAFDMVERARSRTFIELLAGQAIRAPQQAPETLLRREATLRTELNTLYQTPNADPATIAAAEQALDATLQEIRLFAADYADLRSVQPLPYTQVQARLPVAAALLSYFITDDALFAFVVRTQRLTVHRLPLKPADLQRAFDSEGNLMRMRPASDGRLHDPWLLRRLYQTLIEPLLPDLEDVTTLYLLPHGPLHFVPFHALFYRDKLGQARLLLDDYAVVYAPSATVLLDYCQQKRSLATGSLLAVGYNDDLRHAEAETKAIAALVDGSVALVNETATTAALFAQAGSFRWLHFACHGRFNRQAPLMSHLRLAGEPLYASDVLQRLRLQADLVTLAACETGRNQVLKGDELIGLVRAFIYAGTPSVVVSLWPVDELSTRILMERFYQELLAGHTKAAALRAAQHYVRTLTAAQVTAILRDYGEADPAGQVARLLALTHTPTTVATSTAGEPATGRLFAHPYFWAPFVLIGDQMHPPPQVTTTPSLTLPAAGRE